MNCINKTKIARLISNYLGSIGLLHVGAFYELKTELESSLDEIETMIMNHAGTPHTQNLLLALRNFGEVSPEIAERYAAITAKLPIQSKFMPARKDGELRPDWENERIALAMRWWNPYALDNERFTRMEALYQPVDAARTRARVELFESMTQDEREDFAYLLIHHPPFTLSFRDEQTTMLKELLATGNSAALREFIEKNGKYQPDMARQRPERGALLRDGVFLSRLDEAHALSLGTRLLNEIPQPYPTENFDRSAAMISALRGLHGLVEFAPTHAAREQLFAQVPEELKKNEHMGWSWDEPFSRGSVDADVKKLVNFWAYGGEHLDNAWMQVAVMQAFFAKDTVDVYSNPDMYGIVFRDPDPGFVDAVKEVYRRTQAYYQAQGKKHFTVYRGVSHAIKERSPLESWSLSRATCKQFGKVLMKETKVPLEKVLMTWESVAGIFPPEDFVKGQKEVTLMSYGMALPEIVSAPA